MFGEFSDEEKKVIKEGTAKFWGHVLAMAGGCVSGIIALVYASEGRIGSAMLLGGLAAVYCASGIAAAKSDNGYELAD